MKMPFTIFSLLIFATGLTACITGPKNPDQTFAQSLNGENYETSAVVVNDPTLIVPVIKRKAPLHKFAGIVLIGEGFTQILASHVKVEMLANGESVASTYTNSDGSFELMADAKPATVYQIRITKKCRGELQTFNFDDKAGDNHTIAIRCPE